MKTKSFLSLAAIFAIALAFFACSSGSPSGQGGEPSSDSSGDAKIDYCDYGPITQYGGGCFPMSTADDEANCALWGKVVEVCGNYGNSSSSSYLSSGSSSGLSQSSSSVSSSNSVCASNDLGKGYDVIGKPYINWADVGRAVLDQDKMCQDGILELDKPGGAQQYVFFSGSTVEELYSKRNESMKIGANLGVEIKIPLVFSAGVDVKFAKNTSNGSQQSSSNKYFYSQMRSYRYTGEDQIKSGSESARNLSKYLTNDFISDLKSTKSAGQILDRYGSHVFIHYFKGGSLEANYTYTGSTNSSRITSADQMELAVKGSFKKKLNITAGIDYETNNSNEQAVNELETHLSFNYEAYGGKSLTASSDMSELVREYGGWVESIEQNARTAGIKDFAQSFIPIWDLAQLVEGVTSARISDLKSEFKKRAEAQGAKFPEADCTPDDNNSTHYCSNGFLKEYGSVTDGAGKTYKTVVIGTQTWMAENLNYNVTGSKCIGTTLYKGINDNQGIEYTYYLLEDNNTINCDKYGRLYDWATAMALLPNCNSNNCVTQISAKHKGICPSGYHIPTNADWDNLISYVGGENTAGRYLKATIGWNNCGSSGSYTYKCEDKYGFSALPGSLGGYNGEFFESFNGGDSGFWWSSSESKNYWSSEYNVASYRSMFYQYEKTDSDNLTKSDLFSVRCLKD